ncbi:MFS transporter [Bradyrhizobium elkanii]|uniref:MFS transporter n=1 Tax=Bradyrhizobium elkanii TaxID=29448 RepID=UPI003516CDA5
MTGSALRVWLAVIVLGVASFTMVTTEFAPIGLLSQIAFDLGQDQAAVGLAVTLYAWIGAASGLLSAVLLQRCPRKPLLVVLMLVLSATNLAAMHSHSLEALMLARAVGAVVHGFFWAMAAAIAAQIAPLDRMGVATAIVFGGISMATVIGVPLVNLIGQTSGWRTAFGVIGAVGLFASGLMAGLLPQIQAGSPTGWRALAAVLRRRDLRRIYAVTAFMAAANFAAYTFIEPFLGQIPDVPPVMIGVMLFGFGGAGFLGKRSDRLSDRSLHEIRYHVGTACALGSAGRPWMVWPSTGDLFGRGLARHLGHRGRSVVRGPPDLDLARGR